jgi:hypothetical protein
VVIPSVIGSGPHYNVVGRLPGHAAPDKMVLVTAHYDSVMDAGFVDNGAGTAGLLELGRVLTSATREGSYRSRYTLLFVAFASEELGLIGAAHFVQQHQSEMTDIVAVVNLDSLGSTEFLVERTVPDAGGLDLDALMLQAARDVNVPAALTDGGSADHVVFQDPARGDQTYSYCWPERTAGIREAPPVPSSTTLLSAPLLYRDLWTRGQPGWIHTAYDNSSSTQTLGWLLVNDLEAHLKVAALSIVRLSPSIQGTAQPVFLLWWVLAAAVVVVVAVVVGYGVRRRRRSR